jgi:uncharacterized membrane protein YcaP (DUF421 family)
MDGSTFFDGWNGLGRTLVVGVLAYGALVAMLRISGNRTLSKMNAFDFVVTVALGSTLASILLSRSVPLADGVLALALLIALQYLVTWLSVRSATFSRAIKAEPILLVYKGDYLPHRMRRARVVEDEVLAAIRAQGVAALSQVEAVLLETDGSFNVVTRSDKPATTLANIPLPNPAEIGAGSPPPPAGGSHTSGS